jgi:hypothetical protein
MSGTTRQVKRWRLFCITENCYIDGYLNKEAGEPIYCFNSISHQISQESIKLIEIINNEYTKSVIHWKINCLTELEEKHVYKNYDDGVPTKCPVDPSHIVSGIPEKLETIRNKKIRIDEETLPLAGYFKVESVKMEINAGAGQVTVKDLTWPIDVAPLAITLMGREVHKGDFLQVDVIPDTIIGVITANTIEFSNVIHVSSTVTDNAEQGMLVNIFDGVNRMDLGQIIKINNGLGTIETEFPALQEFSTGSYFRITIRYLGPHEMGDAGNYVLGSTKIGASYVTKNDIVRLTYTNTTNVYKELNFIIESLY